MYRNNEGKKMYDTIKLPHSLIESVEKAISESKMGYRNRSEFIIEAVREKIRSIALEEHPHKQEVHA